MIPLNYRIIEYSCVTSLKSISQSNFHLFSSKIHKVTRHNMTTILGDRWKWRLLLDSGLRVLIKLKIWSWHLSLWDMSSWHILKIYILDILAVAIHYLKISPILDSSLTFESYVYYVAIPAASRLGLCQINIKYLNYTTRTYFVAVLFCTPIWNMTILFILNHIVYSQITRLETLL